MMPVDPAALDCRHSRAHLGHTFDAESGWCVHGCGVRDDGLVIAHRSGTAIAAPGGQRVPRPRTRAYSLDVPDITEPLHSRDD
jgi:hypothetical protein